MVMNIEQIMAVIPHRYPFLLIDRIIELEPGKRAVALKQVTINEPFFQGHFPTYPIMPGVLIIEALAQTGAVKPRQNCVVCGNRRRTIPSAGRTRRYSAPRSNHRSDEARYRQGIRQGVGG